MSRRITRIVDVDGVVLKHLEDGSSLQWQPHNAEPLAGVVETFDAWEKQGDCIVLMTARPEHLRGELTLLLRAHGLYWHSLVMGVGNGTRVLYNDKKEGGPRTAVAYNLNRNEGLDYESGDPGSR